MIDPDGEPTSFKILTVKKGRQNIPQALSMGIFTSLLRFRQRSQAITYRFLGIVGFPLEKQKAYLNFAIISVYRVMLPTYGNVETGGQIVF